VLVVGCGGHGDDGRQQDQGQHRKRGQRPLEGLAHTADREWLVGHALSDGHTHRVMKTMAKVLAVAMNVYCTMPPCALHSVVPSICRYQGIMAA